MKKLLRNSLLGCLFYLFIVGCGRESKKRSMTGIVLDEIFLSYNESINYISLDSVYIENLQNPFVKIIGSKLSVNNLPVYFIESRIYQCDGCKYLKLSFLGADLLSDLPLYTKNQISNAIINDTVNIKLPFSFEIDLITDDLTTIRLFSDKSKRINLKRFNLDL